MALQYQFSVGTVTIGSNSIGIATEVSVSYDGDPQKFYGGDYREALAIELGNRSGELRARSVRFAVGEEPLDNSYVTVTLGLGKNSGGLSASLTGCKVTNLEVTSTQNEFVTSNFTVTIGGAEAAAATKGGSWPSWSA